MFIVSWAPGFTFGIYILSKYRRAKDWPWQKTMFWASSAVLFYPIIPIFSIFYYLWKKPEDTKSSNLTEGTKEAKIRLRISQAIHGGIAAPIQLCYQLWLAINGRLTIEDKGIIWNTFKWKDWEGNEVIVPIAAPICIFFTVLT